MRRARVGTGRVVLVPPKEETEPDRLDEALEGLLPDRELVVLELLPVVSREPLDERGDCCADTSETGSVGCVSGAAAGCCNSPHPTRSTTAIVVSSSFIFLQLSILHPSCRRVCGGDRHILRNILEL